MDEFSENFQTAFDPPAPFSGKYVAIHDKPVAPAPNLQRNCLDQKIIPPAPLPFRIIFLSEIHDQNCRF